jgi:spore maturation protein CgeB
MKKKVLHYLDDEKERERITLNGYNLVHERHTTKQRAKEWFGFVESFLEGR